MEAIFHQKMARRKVVMLNCNGRAVSVPADKVFACNFVGEQMD
jgi:hypothetical protein